MTPEHEIAVGLGRVEGKLDAFLSMQTAQAERIDAVEKKLDDVSTDVTILKATKAQGHSWLATALSILGVAMAALAVFFTGGPGG